jgi:hypothetical protein
MFRRALVADRGLLSPKVRRLPSAIRRAVQTWIQLADFFRTRFKPGGERVETCGR